MKSKFVPHDRACSTCNTLFRSTRADHVSCSDNCRAIKKRHKDKHASAQQDDTIEQLQRTIEQQDAQQLAQQAARQSRTESVRQINPAWQVAQQACDYHQTRCDTLRDELGYIEQRIQEIESPGFTAYQWATVSVITGLIGLLLWHDHRRKPLSLAAIVASGLSLLLVGLLFHWLQEKWLDKPEMDEPTRQRWEMLLEEGEEKRAALAQEQELFNQQALLTSQVPKYLLYTITTQQDGLPGPDSFLPPQAV